ncbi:MAG: hypothetical protein R3B13_26165 [Polyangiaceae bacterium]
MSDSLFLQRYDAERLVETRVRGDRSEASEIPTPREYLALPTGLPARLARAFAALLRVFAYGLWLCPLLLVPKALLNWVDPLLSDGVLIGFVLWILGFFSSLSGLVLMRLLGGARDELRSAPILPDSKRLPPGAGVAALPPGSDLNQWQTRIGQPARLRGTVIAGAPRGDLAVARDLALQAETHVERLVWTTEFRIESDAGLLELEFESAPVLLAPRQAVSPAEWFPRLTAHTRILPPASVELRAAPADATLCGISDGDTVDVRGVLGRVTEEEVAAAGASGYRATAGEKRRLLVMRSELGAPVVLERIAGRSHHHGNH